MTSTKELTFKPSAKLHGSPSYSGTVISLASAEEGAVSINENIRVLSRLYKHPYYMKSRTNFFIVRWNDILESNTTTERGIQILQDVSVPIQNVVVVCEMKSDVLTESKTNLEMSGLDEDKLSFFGKIISLQTLNKVDTALRTMFREIDQLVVSNKISLCNDLFVDPRAMEFNKDLQIGLLAITLPWKSKLPNRMSYINFVKSTLNGIYSKEKTEKLLSGLI